MKKGKIIVIISAVVVLLIAVGAIAWNTVFKPLSATISSKGYVISVPAGWTSTADGTMMDKNGKVVGKFLLLYEEPDMNQMAAYTGFTVQSTESSEAVSAQIYKNKITTNQGKATQYFIYGLPNPEPYAVSITLLESGVNSMLADRIGSSLTLPPIGAKPPKKNLPAPKFEEMSGNQVVVMQLGEGGADVYYVSLIDSFVTRQKNKESTGVDILCYTQTEEGTKLSTWTHMESDNGSGYLYTYYDRGDGIYTYDNNPLSFDGVAKEINTETGMTSYLLKLGETEISEILKIPTNVYRDNAEELAAMKTTESTTESILKILQKIYTPEQMESVTVEKTEGGLVIVVDDTIGSDRGKLSKDAAVLFGLNEDIENITMKTQGGETFVFTREETMNVVEKPIDQPTVAPDEFVEFTEDIEVIPPAQTESEKANASTAPSVDNSGEQDVAVGTVIYSTTVVISPSMKVKHPRTGEMVAIGPYAEKYGYGGYLNKPIYCAVKRTSSGYLGTATCNGTVLYSRAVKTREEANGLIAQIRAYS